MQYNSIISRILTSFFLKFIGSLSGFLTIIITARLLGAEGRGEVALFLNLLNLILAFTSTFSGSFSYLVGNLKYNLDRILNFTLILTISFIPILAIGFFILKYPFWYYILIAFVFANVLYYIEGVSYGIDNFRLVNIIRNFPSVLTFILTFLLLSYKNDVKLAIISQVLAFFIVFLFIFPSFIKFLNVKFDFEVLKIILRHGTFIGLSTVTTFMLYRIDFFLIDKFYSKSELGIYSIAISIGEINFIILSFITSAVVGRFFSKEAKSILKQSIIILWIFQLIGIILFILFGKLLIELLFTKEFSSAYLPSLIMLISTAIYNPVSVIAIYLNVKLGKSYIPFVIALFSLIFKLVIALFLIKHFSLIGASLSSLFTYTLTFSIYAFIYFKFIKN